MIYSPITQPKTQNNIMKKECTCKKLVKDDKITLIRECDLGKKNRRKELKLAIELVNKLIELKNK